FTAVGATDLSRDANRATIRGRSIKRGRCRDQDRFDEIVVAQLKKKFPRCVFGSENANNSDFAEAEIVREFGAQSLRQIRHFGERRDALPVKPIDNLTGAIRWLGNLAQLVEMQRFDVAPANGHYYCHVERSRDISHY